MSLLVDSGFFISSQEETYMFFLDAKNIFKTVIAQLCYRIVETAIATNRLRVNNRKKITVGTFVIHFFSSAGGGEIEFSC